MIYDRVQKFFTWRETFLNLRTFSLLLIYAVYTNEEILTIANYNKYAFTGRCKETMLDKVKILEDPDPS